MILRRAGCAGGSAGAGGASAGNPAGERRMAAAGGVRGGLPDAGTSGKLPVSRDQEISQPSDRTGSAPVGDLRRGTVRKKRERVSAGICGIHLACAQWRDQPGGRFFLPRCGLYEKLSARAQYPLGRHAVSPRGSKSSEFPDWWKIGTSIGKPVFHSFLVITDGCLFLFQKEKGGRFPDGNQPLTVRIWK